MQKREDYDNNLSPFPFYRHRLLRVHKWKKIKWVMSKITLLFSVIYKVLICISLCYCNSGNTNNFLLTLLCYISNDFPAFSPLWWLKASEAARVKDSVVFFTASQVLLFRLISTLQVNYDCTHSTTCNSSQSV